MTVTGSPAGVVDRGVFRDVVGHFMTGVTVVTTGHDGARFGVTASAVASLSLDPPMVLVCLNRALPTCAAVRTAEHFVINILAHDQGELATQFATRQIDKFRHARVQEARGGVPVIADALAHLECRVVEHVDAATHTVFLAEVEDARSRAGAPLAYFRGAFGRFEHAIDEDGGVVAPLTVQLAWDAYDARAAVECGIVDQVGGRLTRQQIDRLRAAAEATIPWIRGDRFVDLDRYLATNAAFHEMLVHLSGNLALLHGYRRLATADVMARALLHAEGTSDRFTRDHVDLVDALEDGDLAEARRIVLAHAELGKERVTLAIEAAGGRC